jgi:hypothetical protein
MRWVHLGIQLAFRSIRRPQLAADLVRVSWRFRSRAWHRRFPFLPLPDRDYLRWRMYTAYGDDSAVPSAHDVERYAHWAIHSK